MPSSNENKTGRSIQLKRFIFQDAKEELDAMLKVEPHLDPAFEARYIQIDTSGPTDFNFFPRLPTELRFKIWKFAVPTCPPRILHYPTMDNTPYPAIAHAVKESRAIYFGIYTPLCDQQSTEQTRNFRVNFTRDILVLETEVRGEPTPLHAAAKSFGTLLRGLRFLKVDIETAIHGISKVDGQIVCEEGGVLRLIGTHCSKLQCLFVQAPPRQPENCKACRIAAAKLLLGNMVLLQGCIEALKRERVIQDDLYVVTSDANEPEKLNTWRIIASLPIEMSKEVLKKAGKRHKKA